MLTGSSVEKPKTNTQLKYDLQMDPVEFCWSHAYKVKLGHSSTTCTRRKHGHHNTATRADIMRGSTANKNWVYPQYVIVPPTDNHNTSNTKSSAYLLHIHTGIISQCTIKHCLVFCK